MKAFAVLAGLVAVASAVSITEPTDQSKWDFSQSNTIEWKSVSSDPTSFKIILVNHQNGGTTQQTIKDSVTTSDNKYTFTNFVTTPGDKYTIQFISTSSTNSGILSESEQFNVTKSGVAPTTTSAAPSTSQTTTGGAATTTSPNAATSGKTFGAAGLLAVAFAMLL
ncbi:hypothetical protein GQ53DRAFT_755247 [Thozetella sp. PMI_491]|nr:hypothetical protein GQ53DRAFT_755247 [Thozetella sp. PMI_491]